VAELGGVEPPLGSSSTTLEPAELAGNTSTLTEALTEVSGVAENGQGGHFQVFSIRGISRHRVLSLVSGMRIHSERRAGASVSFVDPLLLGSVSVLRGPATALHGSGALGGVVQVFPRSFEGWNVRAGYDSQGNENYQIVGYGDGRWSFGLARRDAGDAEAADGSRLNSHFTQYSATLLRAWGDGPRRYELLFVPTLADQIGKANVDFPGRTTNYPRERHQMLKFSAESEKGWRVRGHLHGHDLETEVVEGASRNRVVNESLDYGARWDHERSLRDTLSLTYGVEASGRHGVDAEETDETGATAKTLDDAREIETGGFLTLRWEPGKTGVETGVRATWLQQQNAGDPDENGSALSGFAGIVQRVGERVELRASLSSGLRFPSLSERFFSGTTGAGQIVGNPDLDRERSLSSEVSARWLGRKWLVHAALFHNEIDDYIERVEVAPDQLTFVNLSSGTLRGIELQGTFRPAERWSVGFGGHAIEGRDDADVPLADVPPDEAWVSLQYRPGSWSSEARLTARAGKTDTGSGENAIPSAQLLRASLGRRLAGAWSLSISGSNLLDELYFASADRKASPAPGRSFGLHLVREGG
jgi:iron complex outermembrane receptor protein